MASFDSTDGIDYKPNWGHLSPEKKQVKINQSRNYLRYRLAKGWTVNHQHPMLTPEEKLMIEFINDTQQALKQARIGFFRSFYENCPRVGSTLKKKVKVKKNPLEDILGNLDTI